MEDASLPLEHSRKGTCRHRKLHTCGAIGPCRAKEVRDMVPSLHRSLVAWMSIVLLWPLSMSEAQTKETETNPSIFSLTEARAVFCSNGD